MIELISIDRAASYTGPPVELRDLAQFNFIYGPNGSGKTTISRLIANIAAFPHCCLKWQNGQPLETLVYNRDFVSRVLVEAGDLPGIFSLGEDSAELLGRIKECMSRIAVLEDQYHQLQATLEGDAVRDGKRQQLVDAKEMLTEACWQKRTALGEECNNAFQGLRASKAKFVEAVLAHVISSETAKRSKQYLQERSRTVFSARPEIIAQIVKPDFTKLRNLQCAELMAKVVVGKKDLNIAALIENLRNSDWVRAGQELLATSGTVCPFCQQTLPASLEKELNDYFDETYHNDLSAIAHLQGEYRRISDAFLGAVDALLAAPPTQLKATLLREKRDALSDRLILNHERISHKRKEPSSVIAIEETDSLTSDIESVIQDAFEAIAAHNEVVLNHSTAKRLLINECWRYLLEEELKVELDSYKTRKVDLDKAISSLEGKIRQKQLDLSIARDELARLQRQTTSVEPTIIAINGVLRFFGFEGFKLAAAESAHCYKLVRSDGSDARGTLSEGERTFIGFLYFYNLIQGSHDSSGSLNDRVIVFDDPVSSLDSDVLFVVSTLIKRVQQDVLDEQNRIRQMFVLTHNVYFHKEVTFNPRGSGVGEEQKRYWTVRKCNGVSTATSHQKNPIKTGYQLLWDELRSTSGCPVAIQNAMRRILEHYFKVLGGREPLDICQEFAGQDQLLCRSLISWINDGSHHASDDLYVVVDQEAIDSYRRVFKAIFEKTGHSGHYEMMMGTPPGPRAVPAAD
jgi:wobble nucleotide-excising tRNase